MARMIRMFLIICCMIVQTYQYENGHSEYKTLHVYSDDPMNKPAIFTANSREDIVSNKRQKRDSNTPNDKKEINKNITTAVSFEHGKQKIQFVFHSFFINFFGLHEKCGD